VTARCISLGSCDEPEIQGTDPAARRRQRADQYPAIAMWLARSNPLLLIPADIEGEARMLEAMDYIVSTVHMQGFTRIVRPGNFTPNEADQDAVKARGREILAKGLKLLDASLRGRWLVGSYSLADIALMYVENWVPRADIATPAN